MANQSKKPSRPVAASQKKRPAARRAAAAPIVDSYSPCAVNIHPGLRDFVGYSLTKLGFRIRQRMEELLASDRLVAPQCGILRLLQNVGPMTQVELGQHMLIDKATMVRMIDGLEELGFAVRKEHAVDRRAKVLSITPKGAKILDKIREARIDAEERVLAPLDAKERAEFKRLINKLASPEPA